MKAFRRLRGTIADLADQEHAEAQDLQEVGPAPGCVQIVEVVERQTASVSGVLRSLTFRPRSGTPAIEAELYDGSAAITLVWLGRRRIRGVTPGSRLRAIGRVVRTRTGFLIFNPAYELLP